MSATATGTTSLMSPTTRAHAPSTRLEDRPYDDSHAVTKLADRAVAGGQAALSSTLSRLGYGHKVDCAERKVDVDETATANVRLGQRMDLVGVMLTLVIAGVVGFVGLFVMSDTAEQTSLSEGDMFYNASQDLTQGVSGAFGQLGIVFTVIILTVIVSYLTLMRGR